MASRGTAETAKLRGNIESQLTRLLTQLQDLEELKAELDPAEYDSMKQETLAEMRDFEAQLERWKSGDLSLIDRINAIQLAMQQAVSQAFRTPEVIQLFAARQPQQLRNRLADLERDRRLGKMSEEAYGAARLEVLTALSKLEAELSPEEREALVAGSSAGSRLQANSDGEVSREGLVSLAQHQIRSTHSERR